MAITLKEPAHANGVNFFRTHFYNEKNREIVEACRRNDEAYIGRHITAQDEGHPEKFTDELFENRVGMQVIHALLASGPPRAVLDIACGNAELLRHLARSGHEVAGIDVSPVRVAINRRDLPRLEVAMAERIPFASATFDVVVAQECLEHVVDLDRSLREVHRLLRGGGLFLCQVPNGTFADGENHVRLFTAETLRWCCETIGFEVVSLSLIPYLVGEPPNNLFLVGRKAPAA